MSYQQDLKDNKTDIKQISKELSTLNTRFEVMSERVNTIQKLVYGLVGIALTAVVYAILNNIGL
jgi:hypothetical protein